MIRHLLNPYLRMTEKRRLSRVDDPKALRRAFEINARLFFWPPRGAAFAAREVAGVPVTGVNEHAKGPLILYLHGGGYVFGSPRTHRAMVAHLSRHTGFPALLPDYRKAPEHAFPAPVEDALAVYRAVMARPGGIIFGGDSAGGGLALALLAECLRLDLPLPRALFAFSPLTDLTFSGASVKTNAASDVVLPAHRTAEIAEKYLQGADAKDPRASPLFADFTGAPPVWITVADREILLDDTVRMAARLRAQGVQVTDIIAHDLPHVWPLMHGLLPEGRATLRDLGQWLTRLSPPKADS
ncbi:MULTISPECIES: alpha/beta hydrolase [unclassified Marinovum]